MSVFWRAIAGSLIVAAVCAGGAGLIVASSTRADVETLKKESPAIASRLSDVEGKLSELEGATRERAGFDAEFRIEQREFNRMLLQKLNVLLPETR